MVKDFRGSEYGVGDTVVYPRSYAQTLVMQEATVLEIKEFEDVRQVRNPYFDEEKPVNWHDNPRYVNETYMDYKVRVQPTLASRYHSDGAKPVWITMKQNIAKV